MSRWAAQIHDLDPLVSYERIYFLLSSCEFSWDIEKALEFALFRTYAVPSISSLLMRSGAFREDARKRYDDTELILSEISENGLGSPSGQAALTRMNDMHASYRISNDDMLYVLCTFVVEPVRWLARFGKRAMTDHEITACVHYYRALGERMGIAQIPETFAAFEAYQTQYERAQFRLAPSNAEVGGLTRDLLLSMYVPKWAVPRARGIVHAVCDAPLRAAMGFDAPPVWLERAVHSALSLRAAALRWLPARRRPRYLTRRRRPTYPGGYQIAKLGTFPKRAEGSK